MEEAYKIIHGVKSMKITFSPTSQNTRTHPMKLMGSKSRMGQRKYHFTYIMIKKWNLLPEDVLIRDGHELEICGSYQFIVQHETQN